jgi:uncharacterized protein (UPF0248 family)
MKTVMNDEYARISEAVVMILCRNSPQNLREIRMNSSHDIGNAAEMLTG